MAATDAKVSLRVLMLGDSGVGKSSLMKRFIDGKFSPSMTATIGIDYASKLIEVGDSPVKLTVWDTAGQERFRSMAAGYYNGSDGVVMVYDVTRRASLDNVTRWMSDLRARVSDGIEVVLVGNKADMSAKREVEEAEGKALAASVGAAAFFETSCRSGANVADAYQALGEHAFRRKMAGAEGPRARKVRVDTETDAGEAGGEGRRCCA